MWITSKLRWFISLLGAGAAIAACAPSPKGLTVRYSFDEPGFPAALRVPGWVGSALRLDGKTQSAEMPASAAMNPGTGDFSVEIWVRTTSTMNRNVIDKRDWEVRGYTLFFDLGGFPGFQVADGEVVSTAVDRTKPINDGQWHHVAAVVKRLPPGPPVIFVDGQRRKAAGRQVPFSSLDSKAALRFGRHHANNVVRRDNIFFPGEMDEFAFYKRALSDADVKSIFAAGRSGKCK